ncbi:hypothetical protein [Empedobacter sp.]|uniref:hypothetical protein n=1 Tax=Empedobacter sp. TaxID=1927715 RepID=UPI00289CA805|nr:hypothetical protein [Empedobacter sp.]
MNNKHFLEILLDENKEMSDKIKRMEELASQMEQSNVRYLNELKRTQIKVDDSGVKQSIDTFRNVVENANKTIDRTQKKFKVTLYSVVFCAIGLASLFFTFKYGISIKSDIKEQYRNELIKNGQYNTPENAEFLRKFRVWIEKNPNDSNDLFRKVEKMEVK